MYYVVLAQKQRNYTAKVVQILRSGSDLTNYFFNYAIKHADIAIYILQKSYFLTITISLDSISFYEFKFTTATNYSSPQRQHTNL